jgi:hypothetical protein
LTVFLAWASAPIPGDLAGPWEELRPAAEDLVLVESVETLSRVYHELKWALPEGTALIVSPVTALPKLRGLPPGTLSWLRDRLPG